MLLGRRLTRRRPQGRRVTSSEVTVAIAVPFHDIDSIGIAWHGHYAKYFEIARCALLDEFRLRLRAPCASPASAGR